MARWDDSVRSAAKHWGQLYGITIDPGLVHGILERESRHGTDPNYVRNRGIVPEPNGHHSYGPMQVYDATLPDVINPGSGLTGPDLASHPELGIWYGTRYLAGLIKRFGPDTLAAISAYNAGPARARRDSRGHFPNQSYVDAVVGFWQGHRGLAMSLPIVLLAGAAAWYFSRRRAA